MKKVMALIALTVSACSGTGDDSAASKGVEELNRTVAAQERRLAEIERVLKIAPASGAEPEASVGAEVFPSDEPPSAPAKPDSASLIEVKVTNKRFDPRNMDARQYSDYIWYDATYVSKLKKRTRSVKGTMEFCDLFGDPKFQIGTTIDEPMEPGKVLVTTGVGFEYNQFMGPHQWMMGTDLKDMTFKFRVTAVLYADGTREDY